MTSLSTMIPVRGLGRNCHGSVITMEKLILIVIFFSLLKVHLQLRGFTVFLDIERLMGGKFDDNLLNSVRNAKHFILVLTPEALDRCQGDDKQKDWVHRVRTLDLFIL